MFKTFLFVCLWLIILDVTAQSNRSLTSDNVKTYRKEWASFGIGVSSDKVFNSIAAANLGVGYHWLHKQITYQAGFSGTSKIGGSASLNVLNAGIGKTITTKSFHVSLIAGTGLMWGKKYNNDNASTTHFVRVGFVANAEIIIKLIKNLGIGFELYTNVNEIQNASGVRVVVHLNNDK